MRTKSRVLLAALSIGLALGLVTFLVALAASIVVDDFTSEGPDIALILPGGGAQDTAFDSAPAPAALGGERDILITGTATTNNDRLRVRVVDDIGGSRLSFAADTSVLGQAEVQWDGQDGGQTLDRTGLGSVDLTDGGLNDGFHIEVLLDDNRANLVMYVYNAQDSASASIALPGNIGAGGHVDFFIPFSSFQPAFDFTNVGAVVMLIDGTVTQGLDLELDLVETDDFRDYGDLPETYGLVSHIPSNGSRFGSALDIEDNPQYSPNATGDDIQQDDDEDGVFPTPGYNWDTGPDGGSLTFIIRGCFNGCVMNGWIDWNADGDFDAGEMIITNERVTGGNPAITFPVPDGADVTEIDLKGRFRICPVGSSCDTPTGEATGGEVEDHQFSFGPTAVTLTSLTAESSLSTGATLLIVALIFVAVMAVAVAIELRRQRRAQQ